LADLRASVLLGTAPTQSRIGIDGAWGDIAAGGEVGLSRNGAGEGGNCHGEG